MTARNPDLDLGKGDPEVLNEGTHVLTTHGDAEDVEAWVKEVARTSNQRVDWGYTGGRAVVFALGDLGAVNAAIESMPVTEFNGVPKFYAPSGE